MYIHVCTYIISKCVPAKMCELVLDQLHGHTCILFHLNVETEGLEGFLLRKIWKNIEAVGSLDSRLRKYSPSEGYVSKTDRQIEREREREKEA